MSLKPFKIRCSSIHRIMGRVGLTDKQQEKLQEYKARFNGEGRPLTNKQQKELAELEEKALDTDIPSGAKTYLKEWYAREVYGDEVQITSKYTEKGLAMEDEAIDFTAYQTGYMFLEKNEEFFDNGYVIGTPDVICEHEILDTKCSWDSVTFLEAVTSPLCYNYEMQMRGYMMLTEKQKARVCYCLMDTEYTGISYDGIDDNLRFHYKEVERDLEAEQHIINRVIACRRWLANYDLEIRTKLGVK
jgi:hypothetical protein